MKVISLLQPWASLVVLGHKKIETRSWNTKHRGPILIHASAGKKDEYRSLLLDFHQEFNLIGIPNYKDLPFGAIIGKVDLVHVVESRYCKKGNEFEWTKHGKPYTDYKFEITHQELDFGDYSSGRYGWLLSDPVQFAQPIPAKGSLRLWEYDMPELKTV